MSRSSAHITMHVASLDIADQELLSVIVDLSEHLCVSRIDERTEGKRLLIAPFSTDGRMATHGDSIIDPHKIRVLHRPIYLWLEKEQWMVEHLIGQTRQLSTFESKASAVDFVKKAIEEYWQTK